MQFAGNGRETAEISLRHLKQTVETIKIYRGSVVTGD
jgi:hypothetical protein